MFGEDEATPNYKKFFNFIKSTKCKRTNVAPLKREGFLHHDATTKANILNQQFASVFTEEDMDNLPDLGISPTPEMNKITINTEGVQNLLQHLQPNKATGPDDIPAKFLKEVNIEISPLISFIFQASLDQGQIPSDWKQARVAPVFKKWDRGQPANYRPISLTSILCKTLEHILHSTIITHLEHNNVLSELQHGFRKKRSTESQLILTVQYRAADLDKGQQIDAILLDFSKAFDKVPHRRLLLKLHHSGVRSNTLFCRGLQTFSPVAHRK